MNGLVAAVLVHYVEIHFGIAISATRVYFFVYAALMLALAGARAVRAEVIAESRPLRNVRTWMRFSPTWTTCSGP